MSAAWWLCLLEREEDDAWKATYQPEDDGVQVSVDEDGDQQPGDGVQTTATSNLWTASRS
jgi:hypothetical protein